MSDISSKSGFTSYVNFNEENEPEVPIIRPILNGGEIIVTEAHNVFLEDAIAERKQNSLGSLFVTNFRLAFRPVILPQVTSKQNSVLEMVLAFETQFDVCLSLIDLIYAITDDKTKKLTPHQNVKHRVPEISIVCKNLRRLNFNFNLSFIDQGKQVANALLHHAFPIKHELLFAYDFQDDYCWNLSETTNPLDSHISFFRNYHDWDAELKRTKCRNWRVTKVNELFVTSKRMPEFFIVPATLLDFYLSEIANNFTNCFLPVWCWGNKVGVALVRMTETVQTISDQTHENVILEHMRKSHNWKVEPTIFTLNDEFVSAKSIRQKFEKFRKLFAPKSIQKFWSHDNNFFSLLEQSDWLKILSFLLKKTVDVVDLLSNNVTVVLQEKNGQDISCVISSLVQLIWDPHWRTRNGFRSLIQKEWIALGHRFSTRLGHTYSSSKTSITAMSSTATMTPVSSSTTLIADEKSPILLLFLDCVWQLTKQFPFAFEFNSNFLISVWDNAHLNVFETFIFDCEFDRYQAVKKQNLTLRSFWQWQSEVLDCGDKSNDDGGLVVFQNALYDPERNPSKLKPNIQIQNLEIWTDNYLRWLTLFQTHLAEQTRFDCRMQRLLNEIDGLQTTVRKIDRDLTLLRNDIGKNGDDTDDGNDDNDDNDLN